MSTNSEMERIAAFQATVDEGAVEEVRDWAYGKALLSPGIPEVWDANYCRLDEAGDASPEEIAGAAREVAAATGWVHVAIVVSEADAARLGPGFAELGFEPTEHITLTLAGRPADPAIEVSPATSDDVEASRRELTLEFSPGNHVLADQLNELDRRLKASIGGEWFVVRGPAGDVLSRCWLLSSGGVAQVEDVATTPSARGRGLAGAVVSAATIAALNAGNDLVFIVADSDGDAQRLYRKLGYAAAGLSTRFVLKPG